MDLGGDNVDDYGDYADVSEDEQERNLQLAIQASMTNEQPVEDEDEDGLEEAIRLSMEEANQRLSQSTSDYLMSNNSSSSSSSSSSSNSSGRSG